MEIGSMKQVVTATVAAILLSTTAWAVDGAGTGAPLAAVKEAPAKPFKYVHKPTDIVSGKDTAKITVVEYASLSCPHCAHFFNEAFQQISDKYIETGQIRFVYRHYPLNDPALKAAVVVNCAD